jgi:hypothetical protein
MKIKNVSLLFTLILHVFWAAAQNNTAKYDSTRNFLGGDVYLYKGLELYVKELPPVFRGHGFDFFTADYTRPKEIFGEGRYASLVVPYDTIVGHHYLVLDVIRDPKAEEDMAHATDFYLKLKDQKDKDICYYKYDTLLGAGSFPFLVTGYMQKLKANYAGKNFVFSNKWFKNSTDYETKAPLKLVAGEKWKCIDIIIEKDQYNVALLLQNTAGQKQTADVDWLAHHQAGVVYTEKEADDYRQAYGTDFDAILAGNVRIGWNKTMCSLAWGNPDHVNPTTTAAGRTEQWVYTDGHYLYFDEHGKLTTIQ